MVLRILSCLVGIGLVLSFTSEAIARCAPDALGTSRVLEIDPKKHRTINGKEASLGLKHKEVILTFDDGPIKGNTSRILKSSSSRIWGMVTGPPLGCRADTTRRRPVE